MQQEDILQSEANSGLRILDEEEGEEEEDGRGADTVSVKTEKSEA